MCCSIFPCCSSVVHCCQSHFHFQIFARLFSESFTRQHIMCFQCVLCSMFQTFFKALLTYKPKLLSFRKYAECENCGSFSISIKCFFLSFESYFTSSFCMEFSSFFLQQQRRCNRKIPQSKKIPHKKLDKFHQNVKVIWISCLQETCL